MAQLAVSGIVLQQVLAVEDVWTVAGLACMLLITIATCTTAL